MKKIMMTFFTWALLFWLSNCSAPMKSSMPGFSELTGNWEEHWGVGEETDVAYRDVYLISKNRGGDYKMSCPARPHYSFGPLVVEGEKITVVLTNASDPRDLYIMTYRLKVDRNKTLMKGKVFTNKDVEAAIEWTRK